MPKFVQQSLPKDKIFNRLAFNIKIITTASTSGIAIGKYELSALFTEPKSLACKTSNSDGLKSLLINAEIDLSPAPKITPTRRSRSTFLRLEFKSQLYKAVLKTTINMTCK